MVDEKDDREVYKMVKVVTKESGKSEVVKLDFFSYRDNLSFGLNSLGLLK